MITVSEQSLLVIKLPFLPWYSIRVVKYCSDILEVAQYVPILFSKTNDILPILV
jgi:hypothetical protein